MITTLLIDDEPSLLEISKEFMEMEKDLTVRLAESSEDALEMLKREDFDIIVSDYQMTRMNGIELLESLRMKGDRTPFILFTGKGREEVVIDALNKGADFYLRKGGDPRAQFAELINLMRQAVSKRETEEALEHNFRRFRSLTENSSDIVAVLNREGEVRYISPSVKRVLGLEPESILGKSFGGIVGPEARSRVQEIMSKVLNQPCLSELIVLKVMDAQGRPRIIEANMTADPDSDDRQVIINARDVTERRMVESELNKERERYRTVFENTGAGTAVIEEDMTVSLVNDEFARLTGYSKEEIEGRMKSMDFVREEDRSRLEEYHWLRRKDPYLAPGKYNFKFLTRSGVTRDCQAVISVVPETAQSIVSVIDLTDFNKMKKEILARNEEQARILDNIGVQVWYAIDPETYGLANRSRAEFLGRKKEDIEGCKLWDLNPREDEWSLCLQGNKEAFMGKKVIKEEWVVDSKGNISCQLVIKCPLFDEEGNVKHIFCTATDITERKKAEEALRMANEKLNLMVNVTRHDILNQLVVVRGYMEILKNLHPDDPACIYIGKVEDAVRRIENHLHFTKEIEALGSEPAAWMKASTPVKRALTELDLRGIQINIDDSLDALQIFSDSMIWKVFYNLAHNTIKHANEASSISIYTETSDGGTSIVYEDNGPGIPEETRDFLFNYAPSKGSGYGLYLVKQILGANKMDISEDGESGKGVRFRIEMPNDRFIKG